MSLIDTKKARIFISYSHQGNGPEWKARLLRHLEVFERHNLLDVWEDGKIRVSSYWDDDIKQAMGSAGLAVVLLTKEALESEYILNTEFPFLRERQQIDKLPVFPVVCEECDWRAHDWLRATQAPNESNPLSQLSEVGQDRIFRQLAIDIAEELSRVALPELPQPDQFVPAGQIFLEKFPLTHGSGRPEKLIGREQELALLDLAFVQSHTAIVSLVAWGGVGKTMLVQNWMQRLHRQGWFGARRVYAWSFYSQGTKEDRQASEDSFLAHALAWFGAECEPTLSPWDKGRLLADAATREQTLLVLDGIEPLQYPPGPMGGRLRAPGVQSLLKKLAHQTNYTGQRGLCLITTREPLADLVDFERRSDMAWGSMLRIDLGNLTEEAGAALLHHAGAKRAGVAEIKPSDTELLSASRGVDGHALTLHLLGRFLSRAHNGDIRRRDLVKFEEADRRVQGGTTFKMLAAFANWFNRSGGFYQQSLSILSILGLFDRPADAGCISALRNPPVISGLTDSLFVLRLDISMEQTTMEPLNEESWNTAISFLAEFGLIAIQASEDERERMLDCHPLIREYFAKKVRGETIEGWRFAHRRLYEHLISTSENFPSSIESIQPLYHAISHACQAGLYASAWNDVFFPRILRENESFSLFQLGAIGADLAALGCFFEKPWKHLVHAIPIDMHHWFLNSVAFRLRALGRIQEAIEPLNAAFQIEEARQEWRSAALLANNLSETEQVNGNLKHALIVAHKSKRLSELSGDLLEQVCSYARLAYSFFQCGQLDQSINLFNKSEEIQAIRQPQIPILYSLQGYLYCEVLIALVERTAWQIYLENETNQVISPYDPRLAEVIICSKVEERVKQILEIGRQGGLSGVSLALDQLILGRIFTYRSIFYCAGQPKKSNEARQEAKERIFTAIDGLRSSGMQDYLPLGLLAHSWQNFIEQNTAGAQVSLDEAWDIAERGPMRLHMADIHLYRARLFFREKHYPWTSPQDDLAAAEKLINDCGYHRRDEELADAKRTILGE